MLRMTNIIQTKREAERDAPLRAGMKGQEVIGDETNAISLVRPLLRNNPECHRRQKETTITQ